MGGAHEKSGGALVGLAKVQTVAKAVVTGIGGLTSVGLLALVPEPYNVYVGLGTALLTTFATYKVPNAQPLEETTAGYPDALKSEPEDALG